MNSAITFKTVYDYILDNKIYRDPTICIERLASQLDMKQKDLTALFNNYCGQSFDCFINGLRIMEAKRLMEERTFNGFSIDAIGRMAGFNSKSEFRYNFKERIGRFPADFKISTRYSKL